VDVIVKVAILRVGCGHLTYIWKDNWVSYQNGHKILSSKPLNCDIKFTLDLIHHDI